MNNKFENVLSPYGLTINGDYAYGNLMGYETNILAKTLNAPPFFMHISFYATDEQKAEIDNALKQVANKYLKYQFTYYGLSVNITDFTISKLVGKLPEYLKQITNILKNNEAVGFGHCPVCGDELTAENTKVINIDGFSVAVDQKCFGNINTVIEKSNEEFKNAPNNYLKGFLGALVGGVAGFAVAFILYLCGVISAISAFVAVVLGAFLYKKFGGKENKMMILIVSVTSLAFMILAVFSVYLYAAGAAAKEAGLVMNAFEAFKTCMGVKEFSSAFTQDLIMTIVFSILSIVYEVVLLLRKVKRPNKFE